MGSSFTNIQVRTKNPDAVKAALEKAKLLPAYVSESKNDWVSVYPRETETQDSETLKHIARELSREVNTGVFGILVHDSDIFMYVLCENGQLIDEYDSDPGYFDGKNVPPSGGKMEVVQKYCQPGTTVEELAKIFTSKKEGLLVGAAKFMWNLARKDLDAAFSSTSIFRGDTLSRIFGEKLGLPEGRISSGYKYIKQGEYDGKDLTLLRNEEEEAARRQGPGGPPVLISDPDQQKQMLGMAPAAQRQMWEQAMAAAQSQRLNAGLNEELQWHGTVYNTGGYSTGLRLILKGAELDQGMFSSLVAHVERWQSRNEENDFEAAEPDDESFWPFVKPYAKTDQPGVWIAEFPDFFYSTEFLIRLPIVPARVGEPTLELLAQSMDPSCQTQGCFQIRLNVVPEKQRRQHATKVSATGGTHKVGPVKLSFPQGYAVEVNEGNFLLNAMGIKSQLSSYKPDSDENSTSLNCLIQKMDDENRQDFAIQDLLKRAKIQNRCRDFRLGETRRWKAGNLDFESASWSSPLTMQYGLQAVAIQNQDAIVIGASTRSANDLTEMEKIVERLEAVD